MPGGIANLGKYAEKQDLATRFWSKVAKFSGQPQAKLTEAQVAEIRASSLSYSQLAAQYGVKKTSIAAIKTHRTWRHNAEITQ